MVAHSLFEPGVYRCHYLIDGRAAFYTVEWNGSESVERVVGEDESEEEVIQQMAYELGLRYPTTGSSYAGASGRSGRPPLFLV